jgi:hypothetical protein
VAITASPAPVPGIGVGGSAPTAPGVGVGGPAQTLGVKSAAPKIGETKDADIKAEYLEAVPYQPSLPTMSGQRQISGGAADVPWSSWRPVLSPVQAAAERIAPNRIGGLGECNLRIVALRNSDAKALRNGCAFLGMGNREKCLAECDRFEEL